MQHFKTVGGMFAHVFAERGEVNDKGEPIVATEEPMTDEEAAAYRKERLEKKLGRFTLQNEFHRSL